MKTDFFFAITIIIAIAAGGRAAFVDDFKSYFSITKEDMASAIDIAKTVSIS